MRSGWAAGAVGEFAERFGKSAPSCTERRKSAGNVTTGLDCMPGDARQPPQLYGRGLLRILSPLG